MREKRQKMAGRKGTQEFLYKGSLKPIFFTNFTKNHSGFMHELSIAMSIVDSVIGAAEKEHAVQINSFTLEIGSLSGIDMESLEFALGSAVCNTALEGVPFRIIAVKAAGICTGCRKEFEMEELFDQCPACGSFNPELIKGRELKIKSIEIED